MSKQTISNFIVTAVAILIAGAGITQAQVAIPDGQMAPTQIQSELDDAVLIHKGGTDTPQFTKKLHFNHPGYTGGGIFFEHVPLFMDELGKWAVFEKQDAIAVIQQPAYLIQMFVGAEPNRWVQSSYDGLFGTFSGPIERLNIYGSMLSSQLATGGAEERLCVTWEGILTDCDNVGE